MRKLHKNMILELLKTLEEATSEAKRLYLKKDTQTLTNLLAGCQDGAIQIGNMIEQLDGDGHVTITYLEKYCELLYNANIELSNPDGNVNIIKKLQKQLIKIENSIKDDIKINKLEIVFFPYKAAMWDSFESIWLAAKNDPQCDVYVVPIPYYNKYPDGTFGKMHYEVDQYPDYVTVVDWQKYNIEKCRPDTIFIHNPYDEFNLVTSVHPDFYAKNLMQYTNCLTYIEYGLPYYISKDPERPVDISKFFVNPAWRYSDVYACFSKELTQRSGFLFKEFKKAVHNKYLSDIRTHEKKFVALGSPKFDKIINSSKNDFTLPDKWESFIDGTDKKIILFVDSLKSVLENCEEYLGLIRNTIESAKNNTDIILWWRPHPLIKETFQSMRPEFIAEYEQIVDYYTTNNLGIYDDSSDLHRAIAWSDAYYGHEGSLMFLYVATGKPFTVIKVKKPLNNPNFPDASKFQENDENDFTAILKQRIRYLKANKGASGKNNNYCIWWGCFSKDDYFKKIHYKSFFERYIHYVINMDEYPDSEEYKQLQLQLFHDFVANHDGTAGAKIYDYCKEKVYEERI